MGILDICIQMRVARLTPNPQSTSENDEGVQNEDRLAPCSPNHGVSQCIGLPMLPFGIATSGLNRVSIQDIRSIYCTMSIV